MQKNILFPIIVLAVTSITAYFLLSQKSPTSMNDDQNKVQMAEAPVSTLPPCIPTFVDGGGPYYKPNAPKRSNLAPEKTTGEKLIVSGRVLENNCVTPLPEVTVDIWQANQSGRYEDDWYRGRVMTNQNGEYSFETVIPKGYGEGTGYRPPHIHFKIWKDGGELITSQMFLPASRDQGIEEAFIMKLEENAENGIPVHMGRHDIILP